jgi:FMN phosphatase YigB (HAD superfamily)
LDKLRNFILLDVDETVVKVDASTGEDTLVKRRLGQVMVPGKHLVKVEVEEKAWQAALVGGQPGAPRDEAKSGAETAPR